MSAPTLPALTSSIGVPSSRRASSISSLMSTSSISLGLLRTISFRGSPIAQSPKVARRSPKWPFRPLPLPYNIHTPPPKGNRHTRTTGRTDTNQGPGARAGERSLGRAQNDQFLTLGVRNTPTIFCITSARVDESVAVAAPMPMVPTRAVMLTGAGKAKLRDGDGCCTDVIIPDHVTRIIVIIHQNFRYFRPLPEWCAFFGRQTTRISGTPHGPKASTVGLKGEHYRNATS